MYLYENQLIICRSYSHAKTVKKKVFLVLLIYGITDCYSSHMDDPMLFDRRIVSLFTPKLRTEVISHGSVLFKQ